MAHDELEDLSYLWDGSENWGLSATYHSDVDLKVVFEGERPSVQELMAVRKLLNEYHDVPVHQVKAQIGNSKELSLGIRSSMEAHHLLEQAQKLGLNLVEEDASHVDYWPVKPVDDGESSFLLIEDEELAKRVTQKMLEAGVPIVEHIEVD